MHDTLTFFYVKNYFINLTKGPPWEKNEKKMRLKKGRISGL